MNLGGTFNVLEGCPAAWQESLPAVHLDQQGVRQLKHRRDGWATRERGAWAATSGRPLDFHSPYGCSKGAADQYVRDYARIYGLRSVVFRMSCIAGPRQAGSADQGWVAHFLYSALEGRPLTIYGDGRQVRDVLHVADLLRAFEAAYARRKVTAGQIYNIGGGAGNAISLLELMERVERLTGERLDYDFAEARAGDQVIYVSDHGKFSRHTGWQPKAGVDEVLSSIHEWYLGQSRTAGAGCASGRRTGGVAVSAAKERLVSADVLGEPSPLRAGQSQLGLRGLDLLRMPRSAHSAGVAVCRAEDRSRRPSGAG